MVSVDMTAQAIAFFFYVIPTFSSNASRNLVSQTFFLSRYLAGRLSAGRFFFFPFISLLVPIAPHAKTLSR
jgi:hypothetical protein